jgi:hypothetical protein
MMHVGRGREHPLHVEYVHIGACLGFIQDTLTEALLSHPRIKMDRKIALVKALNKVIWIQNDLFAKWYVRDGDEFRDEMEVHQYEKEGYLGGQKVLEDIDEEGQGGAGGDRSEGSGSSTNGGGGGPKSPTTPKSCPFSGIPVRAKGEASPPKEGKQTPETVETPVA